MFTDLEIERLVAQVEAGTLPRAEWTHAAHLAFALWQVSRLPLAEATERVRHGIMRFNAAHGIEQTPTGGYHDTLTRFFVWFIARYWNAADRGRPLGELHAQLVAAASDRGLPLRYWSRERLDSWPARTGWIPPDLAPLECSHLAPRDE